MGYRFLLAKGTVGHVVATILVLIVELIERYCPQISTLILYVLAKFGIDLSDEAKLRLIEKQIKKNRNEGGINLKYTGFVGSNVEKHENKEIKKRRDENAAEKLRDLNYLSSKYKYLSEAFMKRHNLGEFEDTSSDHSNGRKSRKLTKKVDGEEKEDEDVDWIVEALANPQSVDKKQETSGYWLFLQLVEAGLQVSSPTYVPGAVVRRPEETVYVCLHDEGGAAGNSENQRP